MSYTSRYMWSVSHSVLQATVGLVVPANSQLPCMEQLNYQSAAQHSSNFRRHSKRQASLLQTDARRFWTLSDVSVGIRRALSWPNQYELLTSALYCCCRRQALDRGGVLERADKIATGHNADDIAETILLNIIRGDVPR